MTHDVTNTLNQFNQAKALILAYVADGAEDSRLPEAILVIRPTCSADSLKKLNADVETLLEFMRKGEAADYQQDETATTEIENPFRQAAIRLLSEFPEPTYEQLQHELNNL